MTTFAPTATPRFTAISLFSGAVDGLAIAAQAAGITVTHHVEWDAWCCRVLRMNHPDSKVLNADIHDVKGLPYADVIMGGSPCQDFSGAGNQAGFAGERYLWPEMRRIVGECRPRVVIHENVRGGISLGLLDRICSDMESDGYTVWPLVYPAAIFGAPHERYRMFHVGLLADTELHRRPEQRTITNADINQYGNIPTPQQRWRTVTDAIEPSGKDVGHAEQAGFYEPIKANGWTYSTQDGAGLDNRLERSGSDVGNTKRSGLQEHITSALYGKSGCGVREPDQQQPHGLPQSSVGRVAHGLTSRLPRLDPVADFPGFPAGQGSYQYPYEPPRTTPEKSQYAKERIQALGNAAVWQQAAPIFRAVVRWLEGERS